MKDLITTKEAMKILGVGSTTIKRWADEGKLESIRTAGGHRRFRLAQVRGMSGVQIKSPLKEHFADEWIDWLESRGLSSICRKIIKLHDKERDWFRVADLLAQVASEIGHHWVEGDLGVVEEHIATEKLFHALMSVSAGIPVAKGAARCLLATPINERHTLGLALTHLCMRSVGIRPVWVGAEVPSGELARYVGKQRPQMVAVTASSWMADPGSLKRYYRELASACEESGSALLLGGHGAWPEKQGYGTRCHTFSELKGLMRGLTLSKSGEKQ